MVKIYRVLVVSGLLMASLCGTASVRAAGEPFNLYVSPKGDDAADGRSEAKALKTLGKALSTYESSCSSRSTRITLAAGSYGREQLTLRSVPCPLEIGSSGGYAQFDGGGDGTWFTLATPGAKQIDLSISGMEVANYQSGVSVNGNRNDPEGWIGGVKVLKNRFVRIGSFRDGQPPATAVVRLVNARSVLIEGNEFQTIRNLTHCGGLHSVYIAHRSSGNRVVGNSFVDGCGETVKVRDSSSNNVVERNKFKQQEGSALFLDSYCDASTGAECTKAEPECPSWNNVFRENTIEGPRPATNKKTIGARKAARKLPANCELPRGDNDRIREERTSQR
jgi:hypothetical protein